MGATGVAAVTSAVVEESGRVVGQTNVLTFRLTSNVPLVKDVELSISGLAGRAEACKDETTVVAAFEKTLAPQSVSFKGLSPQHVDTAVQTSINTASLVGNATDKTCVNDGGSLTVKIPFSCASGTQLVWQIEVTNWHHAIPGSRVQLGASGPIATLDLSGAIAGPYAATDSNTMVLSPRTIAATILMSGHSPRILRVNVSEDSPGAFCMVLLMLACSCKRLSKKTKQLMSCDCHPSDCVGQRRLCAHAVQFSASYRCKHRSPGALSTEQQQQCRCIVESCPRQHQQSARRRLRKYCCARSNGRDPHSESQGECRPEARPPCKSARAKRRQPGESTLHWGKFSL